MSIWCSYRIWSWKTHCWMQGHLLKNMRSSLGLRTCRWESCLTRTNSRLRSLLSCLIPRGSIIDACIVSLIGWEILVVCMGPCGQSSADLSLYSSTRDQASSWWLICLPHQLRSKDNRIRSIRDARRSSETCTSGIMSNGIAVECSITTVWWLVQRDVARQVSVIESLSKVMYVSRRSWMSHICWNLSEWWKAYWRREWRKHSGTMHMSSTV